MGEQNWVYNKILVFAGIVFRIIRVLDYIVTISFGYTLHCVCFNLFCNVWVCVCVGFVMCGCFGIMYTCIYCVLHCLYRGFCIVSIMYIYSYLFCLH